MRFWEIYRFEVSYQLSRYSTWLYFTAVLGIVTLFSINIMEDARYLEYLLTAPLHLAAVASIFSLFGLILVAGISSDAATKDIQSRMEPLLYTTSLPKASYLGGRLAGACTVNTLLLLLSSVLGFIIAYLVVGVDPKFIGPFRLMAYVHTFLGLTFFNAIIFTSVLYSMAMLTRRAMASFAVGAFLFALSLVARGVVAEFLNRWELGQLLDPSGITTLSALKRSWTPIQMNTQVVEIQGALLSNHLIWLGVVVGVLVITYDRFRYVYAMVDSRKKLRQPEITYDFDRDLKSTVAVPAIDLDFDFKTSVAQAGYFTHLYYKEIIFQLGKFFLLEIAFLVFIMAPEMLEGHLGVPNLPSSGKLVMLFNDYIILMAMVALLTLYAGQLVWRERDARPSEIADAAPAPDKVSFVSKLLALVLMLVTLQMVFLLTAVIIQIHQGYYNFEIGVYLRVLAGIQMVDYLLFAVLALASKVVVNQRYVGYLLVFLAFYFMEWAETFGVPQNLLVYGSGPGWSYSEMNGFVASTTAWFWYKGYWLGWTLLLLLAVKLFWVRGKKPGLKRRLRFARLRSNRL